MSFLGDLAPGAIVSIKFDTSSGFAGPITLAGSPAATVYKDGGLTQSAVGVTLTVDFDGVVGLHHVAVDTGADAFYAAGSSFDVVVVAGTVDDVSIAGRVLGSFSLARSAAFARLGAPAGASVSADVAAIKAQTAAIEVDTQDLQARTPAALVGGRVDASVGAMAANTLTASALATDAVTEIQSGITAPSAAAVADAIADELLSGHVVPGSAAAAWSAASGGSDPATIAEAVVDQALAGHTTTGTVGAALARLDAAVSSVAASFWDRATTLLTTGIGAYLLQKLNLITAGSVILGSPVSPVTGELELVRGDDYIDGEIWWESDDWPDLTGATVVATFRNAQTDLLEVDAASVTVVREVSGVAGMARLELPLAHAQSVNLTPSVSIPTRAKYDVQATWVSGREKTLVRGTAGVAQDQTR